MRKNKLFAPFLMLLAAAFAGIVMFRGNYDTTELLVILLCVMIFFYSIGNLIQKKVTAFMDEIREREEQEEKEKGEVIEKEAASEENTEEQKTSEDGTVKETAMGN